MAYGSDHDSSSRSANAPFNGRVGGVTFASESNGRAMREIFNFVAQASSHFSGELALAGSITVQLGSTQGGTPGEWRSSSRKIVLNPNRATTSHLAGTAVFEILNAAAEHRTAALERDVLNGTLDREAAQAGWDPAQFFAMEVERIEYDNGMRHRAIMGSAGMSGTSADLFANEGPFDSYYQRQVGAGHTHSYEFRYNLLREQALSAARREQEASSSSRRGHGSSSHGGHGSSSHGTHDGSHRRRHR
jgi:hypothetical protein